jgi:nucleoside-diphosphate-sugar epimerase
MRVLITGGLGFIGHNLASKTQINGHTAVVLDNCTTYDVVPEHQLKTLLYHRKMLIPKIQHLLGDVTDTYAVKQAYYTAKPDVVVHLASYPRAKIVLNNPTIGVDNILGGTMRMLQYGKEHGVKHFIYASSSMVYGNFGNEKVYEGSSPVEPVNQYGQFKLFGEHMVEMFCKKNDMNYTIIRPSAVYGPKDVTDRVVSKFFYNAVHGKDITIDGDNRLDFTYVEDLAEGISLTLNNKDAFGKTFNLTYGESRTLDELANIVVDITGSKSRIIKKEHNSLYPTRGTLSIHKARTHFGYDPKINLEEGLKRCWEWYQETGFLND